MRIQGCAQEEDKISEEVFLLVMKSGKGCGAEVGRAGEGHAVAVAVGGGKVVNHDDFSVTLLGEERMTVRK